MTHAVKESEVLYEFAYKRRKKVIQGVSSSQHIDRHIRENLHFYLSLLNFCSGEKHLGTD